MKHDWRLDAACRGIDPELWFSDDRSDQATAKRICNGCPVAWPCKDDANDTDDSIAYGIRAGLTGRERTKIRRQREQQAAA